MSSREAAGSNRGTGEGLSSNGWDSAGSGTDGWDDWGGAQDNPVADPWGGDFDESSWQAPRPTSLAFLLVGLTSAALGLLLGVFALFTSDFANDPLGGTGLVVVAVGGVLSGIVSVLALARYQSIDLRKATSAFYLPHTSAPVLRLAVLAVGTLGVLVTSYVFATWLARH